MNKTLLNLLSKAYATESAENCHPEKETAVYTFENKHGVKLPATYRQLLVEFGALNFGGDPYLYTLKELEWAYPSFVRDYKEYQEGYDNIPNDLDPFPIGGFGEGSTAILDQRSGKIFILIHDCAEDPPLEDIAENFEALLEMLAKAAISCSA